MHIYAFGSLCRGEVNRNSDVDLLALVEQYDARFDPKSFSIYSYKRIEELWREGNPFAWHLSSESRLIFSSNQTNFIQWLGKPSAYSRCIEDCEKFQSIFLRSRDNLLSHSPSMVFELSSMFLSIRNIATCYSLGVLRVATFSRDAATRLNDLSVPLPPNILEILERARMLCTRGLGENLKPAEISAVINRTRDIQVWMETLVNGAKNGRI
jgi:hypothetical protein